MHGAVREEAHGTATQQLGCAVAVDGDAANDGGLQERVKP